MQLYKVSHCHIKADLLPNLQAHDTIRKLKLNVNNPEINNKNKGIIPVSAEFIKSVTHKISASETLRNSTSANMESPVLFFSDIYPEKGNWPCDIPVPEQILSSECSWDQREVEIICCSTSVPGFGTSTPCDVNEASQGGFAVWDPPSNQFTEKQKEQICILLHSCQKLLCRWLERENIYICRTAYWTRSYSIPTSACLKAQYTTAPHLPTTGISIAESSGENSTC